MKPKICFVKKDKGIWGVKINGTLQTIPGYVCENIYWLFINCFDGQEGEIDWDFREEGTYWKVLKNRNSVNFKKAVRNEFRGNC